MPRPRKRGPLFDQRLNILVSKEQMQYICDQAGYTPVSEFGRQTLLDALRSRLKVLGRIPCGDVKEAVQESDQHATASDALRAKDGDYFLEAQGDSMAPKIENGDLVLLRPGVSWYSGDICAVQIYEDKGGEGDCEATLKVVYQEPASRMLTLKALNPKYKPLTVDKEYVRIVGVYRGLIRRDG